MYKKLTILGILSAFSCSGFSAATNIELAKQAHQLAVKLERSYNEENNAFCQDSLLGVFPLVEEAGKSYFSNNNDQAKEYMIIASQSLAYTTVEDCSQAASIAIYKQEADDIIAKS